MCQNKQMKKVLLEMCFVSMWISCLPQAMLFSYTLFLHGVFADCEILEILLMESQSTITQT